MRRSRRLTSAERWELGLFLSLLIVTCLCLTAVLKLNALPRLFATGSAAAGSEGARALEAASPLKAEVPTIEILPMPEGDVGGRVSAAQECLPLMAERAATAPVSRVSVSAKPAAKPAKTTPVKASAAKPRPEIKVYNGKKYRYVKTITLRVTAYAPDPRCTWPYPGTTTASGKSVKTNGGRLVASDPALIPMHSLVVVPGYAGNSAVPVLDTGGAIKGRRLDVLLPTFERAKEWGSRNLEVKVYAPVED
jgi:3D (Asp-Asp-Asp) domain-containing protein